MQDPADLYTTEDAGRTLPSYGPAWDAAIEAGIDVTMIERNLQLSPSERLRQMEEANRFVLEVQSRTVPPHIRQVQDHERLREKLAALGPEYED
ncbi:MAG: hypothetical protein AAGF11_25425 [Myxococcota bacterium]